jgi:hypothetical protein
MLNSERLRLFMKAIKRREDADRELLSDLQLPDERVRAKALGSLCPCRNDWELFEQHVNSISQLTKDSCPEIRAHALHILADAALLQSIGDAEYRFQTVEDMLRKKRAALSRGKEGQFEVRRSGRFKKRKGSFVLR